MTKRILDELKIGKIAVVDRPCQEHARMVIMKRNDAPIDDAATDVPIQPNEDAAMADQNDELDVLKSQLADMTKKLETAELIAKMSDEEKEFMKEMDDAKKAGFMGMKPEERAAAMKVKKSLDETLVVEGVTISKSAVGDGMFAVMKAQAKRLDDQAADIAKARDAAELATFTKRANDDFGHLVGTDVEKAAVLRHMATATEEVQKTFGAILKSAEDMIKKGFDTKGHSNGRVTVEGSAAEQLDTLAKAHAKENEMEYAAAYVAVIEKRSDLYELALKEGN